MGKVDTVLSVAVLVGVAVAGRWAYKRFGVVHDTVDDLWHAVKSEVSGVVSGVTSAVGGVATSGSSFVAGVVGGVTSAVVGVSLPMGGYTEGDIAIHQRLVAEYLLRHPAENVANYYLQYPETSSIRQYAFPQLSGLQPVETPKPPGYNAYEAARFLGFPDPYNFGGLSSDVVVRRALAAGWVG